MLVTPASSMPQGTMLPNGPQACGLTLRAKPCMVVIRATRMPMAQILRSGRPDEGGQPDAGAPVDPPTTDAERGQHVDHRLLEAAHVLERVRSVRVIVTIG